jgi:predicted permease
VTESWRQDVRYALRLLRRSPLFTSVAVLSLAIGIGANATIFSVVSAMLLRPLPGLTDVRGIVDIGRTQDGQDFDTSSYPTYADVRARATTLSDVYAFRVEPQPLSLGGAQDAERIYGMLVSGNFFRALGTTAVRGRVLNDTDDKPSAAPVAVISYELWQHRFAGADDAIGRVVPINGHDVAIVGVAPRRFQGTTLVRSDAWMALAKTAIAIPRFSEEAFTERRMVWLFLGGRLKPGITVSQANAELSTIGAILEKEHPDENRGKGLKALPSAIVPGRTPMVAGFLALLLAIVGLVLLVACVNIAGMLLARAAARRREIAVRLAVGASRGRLVRQLLTETTVLFAAGCAGGLLLSDWLTSLLLSVLPALPFPIGIDIVVDWRVVAFAMLASLGAAILAGLAPALQASRHDLVPALKVEPSGNGGRLRLRSAFVVAQIAMSLILIVAAGLFIRTLARAANTDPGFDQANVDVITVDLAIAGKSDADSAAFASAVLDRVRALPAVESAAFAADLPIDGSRMGFGSLRAPGVTLPSGRTSIDADWNSVTPGFFRTLRIPLIAGRDFTDQDSTNAAGAIIVNEAFARSVWGTPQAVGRQLEMNSGREGQPAMVTVIGVASNAQMISLGGTVEPYVYVALAQHFTPRVSLVVKGAGARSTIPAIRAAIRDLNPYVPVTAAMPLTDVTALGLIPQRLAAAVAGSLGIVVLLLAALGIYGITAYSVSRRTREMGIRVALGADSVVLLRLILRQGLMLTAIGVAIGLAAGALVSQVLRSLLFGVSALDPVTFGGASLLFLLVALAATYGPARRATRVDPMVALRTE